MIICAMAEGWDMQYTVFRRGTNKVIWWFIVQLLVLF